MHKYCGNRFKWVILMLFSKLNGNLEIVTSHKFGNYIKVSLLLTEKSFIVGKLNVAFLKNSI